MAGHPDRARRHDQPRRRGGPAAWAPAACPAAATSWWIMPKRVHPGRQDLQAGRLDQHRRLHRQHLRRGDPPPWTPPSAAISADSGLSRLYRQLGCSPTPTTRNDAQQGVDFGAEGIGLCRTEHMFFEATRIKAVREMIVAEDVEGRKRPSPRSFPFQQGDFEAMYKVMGERPMTIRYLDPPAPRVPAHQGRGHRRAGAGPGHHGGAPA